MKIDSILGAANSSANVSFVYDLNSNQFNYFDNELERRLNIKSETDEVLSIIHQDDLRTLKQHFEQLLKGWFDGNIEFRICINKNIRWLRLTPFLLSDDNDRIIIGNLLDITAEKENFYSLEKFANKKNSVLNMLSHDLRGPLEIARMLAQSLESNATDPQMIKNQSQNLVKILKQGLDIVNDLIQREATETMRVELVKKRINLSVTLKEYMDELKLSEQALNRVINFSSSPENIYADIDEAKFMQVLNNLVSNSLKFTRKGDKLTMTAKEANGNVLISFSDTGIGIPQKYHTELFEKFTPARRKGLDGEPSIGLGLSIIKDIIEWHGGRIWVESEENQGTTFHFEMPKSN
ncbi:ATP-binding protein [Mucilaginibacter ximonensis]|uniref:histidine kinase n=1 Tax=Mucilaginibacter ximonensis TaxID=538021 RepID=A0ABW5YEQ4_9SPHI